MSQPPEVLYYDEGSFSAALYDIVEGVLRPAGPEVVFYRGIADEHLGGSGEAILDLGTGTGRIALPLAAAGYEVDALDSSPAMLAVAEGKRALCPADVAGRVRLRRGDMREFDLGRTYRLAIAPFRSFNFLLEPSEQVAFLSCLRRHLTKDGHAVIDTFGPDRGPARTDAIETEGPGQNEKSQTMTVTLPGTRYRIAWSVEDQLSDPLSRVAAVRARYVILDTGGAVLREQVELLRMRWTEPEEFRAQLAAADLRVVAEYEGLDRRPIAASEDRLWLIAPK